MTVNDGKGDTEFDPGAIIDQEQAERFENEVDSLTLKIDEQIDAAIELGLDHTIYRYDTPAPDPEVYTQGYRDVLDFSIAVSTTVEKSIRRGGLRRTTIIHESLPNEDEEIDAAEIVTNWFFIRW